MKYTIHMELIILILAFGWLPYAVYNTVTWCSHGAVVSFQMFLQLLCKKLDFFIVHSPTFLTACTLRRSKITIHLLCIIALLGFVLNSVEWVFSLTGWLCIWKLLIWLLNHSCDWVFRADQAGIWPNDEVTAENCQVNKKSSDSIRT